MMPSPPGFDATSISKSGFQLLRTNVTILIDHYTRLTHHRDEAGRLALTI